MSEFSGKKLNINIFGESHADFIGGAVLGLPEFDVDLEKLQEFLARRKPNHNFFTTSRVEEDKIEFCGLKGNKTTDNISFTIQNKNIKESDYLKLYGILRPSHADLGAYYRDGEIPHAGGGRFSGRLTLPLCVIGGICIQYLESLGVKITSYISDVGKVHGLSYKDKTLDFNDIEKLKQGFPSLIKKKKMLNLIKRANAQGDSVGGKIECVVFGYKKGIGDNLFGGLEGKISHLLYSVPAVKGVEFGLGFDFSKSKASKVNDQMEYDGDKIKLLSNNNGGINGGISNGEPICIGVGIKPTPSIKKEQKTVDIINKKNTLISISGRHDSCIAVRCGPVIESAVAISLLDELLG